MGYPNWEVFTTWNLETFWNLYLEPLLPYWRSLPGSCTTPYICSSNTLAHWEPQRRQSRSYSLASTSSVVAATNISLYFAPTQNIIYIYHSFLTYDSLGRWSAYDGALDPKTWRADPDVFFLRFCLALRSFTSIQKLSLTSSLSHQIKWEKSKNHRKIWRKLFTSDWDSLSWYWQGSLL